MIEETENQTIEDSTILKSTEVLTKGYLPYRYVLRYVPLEDQAHPYIAHRENMKLVEGIWHPIARCWCSHRASLIEAEKEYQVKVDSEPKH